MYANYVLTVWGGTGDFAQFNGTWPLSAYLLQCTQRYHDPANSLYWTLYFQSTFPGALLTFAEVDTGVQVEYLGPVSNYCQQTLPNLAPWVVISQTGSGDVPQWLIQ